MSARPFLEWGAVCEQQRLYLTNIAQIVWRWGVRLIAGCCLFTTTGCGLLDFDGNLAGSANAETEAGATVVLVSTLVAEADDPPTATPQPSATPSPSPTATPTVEPMPIPTLTGPIYTYHTVGTGETLSYLAWRYDISIEELVAMNDLEGPSALIQVNQSLRVPIEIETMAPAQKLLPDSEVVYGPSYVGFDIAGFVESQGGYLATYEQYVDGELLSGADAVMRVAEQFSVGPRLLLALLEYYGGWVTNPEPTERQLNRPLGPQNPRGSDLYLAMGFTANRVNAGYYSYKRDGFWIFELADRSLALTPEGLNAGTVGLQNILAIHSNEDSWPIALSDDGFTATYHLLFGDPFEKAIGPLVPADLTQPPLSLPWRQGQGFYFTGGPHPGYIDGSAWAAIDFGPPDVLGNCFYSNEPNTAVGDGVIVTARQGEVHLDLDGDGNIQTGWVLLYFHMALDIDRPVQVGQTINEGDVIGYASCEGGLSNSSHLHLARRYNGEWIEAGGPVPFSLSGWVVQPARVPYGGYLTNGLEIREPCECWEADKNLIVHRRSEE